MIECDLESFNDYRERLAISDGHVKCCETKMIIPAGFVYAECQGLWAPNGEMIWDPYPQALEIWRLLRNQKVRYGHCLPFSGVEEILGLGDLDGDDQLFVVRWRSTVKRVTDRYEAGKKPRLHPWEAGALESGQWYDWIQCPAGGFVFELTEDKSSRVPVPPNTPHGQLWLPAATEEDEING